MYSLLNTYAFTYQKSLLNTLLLLVFKIVESLQCILKRNLSLNIKQAKFISFTTYITI